MRLFSVLPGFLMVLLGIHPTFPAQVPASVSPQKDRASKGKALQRDDRRTDLSVNRILEVLIGTAEDSKKWDDSTVAAKTQSQIADLLWEADNDKGRAFLHDAWRTTSKIEESKQPRSSFMNSSLRNNARREVLLVARKHDADLAGKWLDEMTAESAASDKGRGAFDDRSSRSAVLLQMANEIAATNPAAASELAIESLKDGISFNFQLVLVRIQQHEPALAERVFRAALNRLRMGMNDPDELLILYAYLYTPGRVFGINTSDSRNRFPLVVGGPRPAVTAALQNPGLAFEFLGVAADLLITAPLPAATNNPSMTARSQLSAIGRLMREVSEWLPEKAALLQARAQQIAHDAKFSDAPTEPRPDVPEPLPGETQQNYLERRVDILEEAAAKISNLLGRDIAYAKAAFATTPDSYERGLKVAGKIDEKELRENVRNWLIYRAVLHSINAGKLDEAYELNLRNGDRAQRAVCLVVGSQKLILSKANVRATEWLQEAEVLVRKADISESWTRIALGIVSAYGRLDDQLALGSFRSAVKIMKNAPLSSLTDDKAPSLKRFSGLTSPADFTSATTGFSLQSAVDIFTPEQFEEVLSILRDLTPPEARGLAIVILCRNQLRSRPNAKSI